MYKEIVTKAIIEKCKKTFRDNYEFLTTNVIDTVLGCWVINSKIEGNIVNQKLKLLGSFDVNIWYSYDNNTKTAVEVMNVNYSEDIDIKLDEEVINKPDTTVNLTFIKNPTVVDVNLDNNKVKYEVEKEIGIEIIGDTKIKIQIMNESDDYISLDNELTDNEIDRIVDAEVSEKYL